MKKMVWVIICLTASAFITAPSSAFFGAGKSIKTIQSHPVGATSSINATLDLYCVNVKWETFTSDDGKTVVEFNGTLGPDAQDLMIGYLNDYSERALFQIMEYYDPDVMQRARNKLIELQTDYDEMMCEYGKPGDGGKMPDEEKMAKQQEISDRLQALAREINATNALSLSESAYLQSELKSIIEKNYWVEGDPVVIQWIVQGEYFNSTYYQGPEYPSILELWE